MQTAPESVAQTRPSVPGIQRGKVQGSKAIFHPTLADAVKTARQLSPNGPGGTGSIEIGAGMPMPSPQMGQRLLQMGRVENFLRHHLVYMQPQLQDCLGTLSSRVLAVWIGRASCMRCIPRWDRQYSLCPQLLFECLSPCIPNVCHSRDVLHASPVRATCSPDLLIWLNRVSSHTGTHSNKSSASNAFT